MLLLDKHFWEIRKTKEKGQGIFAKKLILKGTVIGDYLGIILHPADVLVDEENFYLMYYHDYAVISPNLTSPGVHILNHSCQPNAWLYTYEGHTLAFALQDIKSGEEITISYLLPPTEICTISCPHVCRCHEKACTKTMHLSKDCFDKWRDIYEAWSKKTKRKRISYGKPLAPLLSYPKIPKTYMQQVLALLQ